MPRVTYETYRQRHLQLRRLWQERQGEFVAVDPIKQWDLHEYFLCADRPTEASLRSHYDEIKASDSSLPSRAGKAYAELMRCLARGTSLGQPPTHPVIGRRKSKVLTVRSLVKPQIDVDEFVRIGLEIAERIVREEEQCAR